MKAIENITKIFKMIAWLLASVGIAFSIVCTVLSFKWIKSLPTAPVFPDNED